EFSDEPRQPDADSYSGSPERDSRPEGYSDQRDPDSGPPAGYSGSPEPDSGPPAGYSDERAESPTYEPTSEPAAPNSLRPIEDTPTAPPVEPASADNGAVAEARPAEESVETVGGDEVEDIRRRHRIWQRRYKIQEVIRKRQILLVQVAKEERGN